MTTYEPSTEFRAAAEYVATDPSLKKLGNETKLQLYGLYKLLTVSRTPQGPRPGMLSFEGRAKWDAWDKASKDFVGQGEGAVERRYLEICRSLGWEEGALAPAKEAGAGGEKEERGGSGGGGMGVSVSQMLLEDEEEHSAEDNLQGAVVRNDVGKVREYLAGGAEVDSLDRYGFTALHLAADRGYKEIVQILLDKGANVGIKDPDGETGISLAKAAGHDDIVTLIQQVLLNHGEEGQDV
ncbi:ankyrin [Calocera viscosa TUFC12733]|uniref:Ankyrin n=1 Tax=Calocera viscosa (strain TUFC12733) TaxID=1330018 RepID=A0A167RD48_CALVF|nr:ankyrin [Calocera viscosa TUFC12733]